ncbi:MAG: hypothetical protein NZ902_02085 [Acidilobaceae archaeon]|nr:hypothetical protein [Acidilobaceae archaeon]MCX8165611.1 hypothetical protein [Acidilobaceae archaeon]MDW7974038.1 hypothetical protein [Sulfolobales archaeon]
MSSRQSAASKELIEKLRKLVLEKYAEIQSVMEVGDVSVTTALVDDDIEKLVLIALKEAGQPLSWRDLKVIFSGVVGEDRLRRILVSLKAKNEVAELTHTRFALPEYVSINEINRVKNPGIINRILKKAKEAQ